MRKRRFGFTIAFNAFHHLVQTKPWSFMNKWVAVEGLALPGGSTSWCKEVPYDWHRSGSSTDGTYSYLAHLEDIMPDIAKFRAPTFGPWKSKDEMVNVATKALRASLEPGETVFLWQIDADENWHLSGTDASMRDAEDMLESSGKSCGMFLCDYWCGPGIQAKGEWGEGRKLPYRRLWMWGGQDFKTHEPPVLDSPDQSMTLLPQRFDHKAYHYPVDVEFKATYYGDPDIENKWWRLQVSKFPIDGFPLSDLISGPWSQTDTRLYRVA